MCEAKRRISSLIVKFKFAELENRKSQEDGFMPSIQYKMVESLFKIIGVNKMLAKEGEAWEKLLKDCSIKQKKPLKVPYTKLKDEFEITEKRLGGVTCYVVKRKDTAPKIGVLYLFGGGYILPPDSGDLILCGQIAKNCNAQVWFPVYPMAPEHRIVETLSSTLDVYKDILHSHSSDNTRIFGTSSGGGQALSLCAYMKHEQVDIPMPGKLVLQSPGVQVPPSDEQKRRMEQLKKYDVMIPPVFFEQIAPVLATGAEEYLLSPILEDMTGFPSTDVFYGTHEVMYAYLEDMKKAYEKYGVELNVHIGKGMMHCWGAMEFVPEAKAVRQEYFRALR